MLLSCHSAKSGAGREYALAVAAGATDSTRPEPGSGRAEMIAVKRPFTVCCTLLLSL